jgi:hypothetical protein
MTFAGPPPCRLTIEIDGDGLLTLLQASSGQTGLVTWNRPYPPTWAGLCIDQTCYYVQTRDRVDPNLNFHGELLIGCPANRTAWPGSRVAIEVLDRRLLTVSLNVGGQTLTLAHRAPLTVVRGDHIPLQISISGMLGPPGVTARP